MKVERKNRFDIEDRYHFDFGPCTTVKGFAQVDTGQDAPYFGTWANPTTCTIINYAEGDITTTSDMSPDEFAAELREMKRWCDEGGHGFRGIDPGLNEALKAKFVEVGLGDLLH